MHEIRDAYKTEGKTQLSDKLRQRSFWQIFPYVIYFGVALFLAGLIMLSLR